MPIIEELRNVSQKHGLTQEQIKEWAEGGNILIAKFGGTTWFKIAEIESVIFSNTKPGTVHNVFTNAPDTDRYIRKEFACRLVEMLGFDADTVDDSIKSRWVRSRNVYGEVFVNIDDLYDFFATEQDDAEGGDE